MSWSEASSNLIPQALYMRSKILSEICLLLGTQSYYGFHALKWDFWPLGLVSSFLSEKKTLLWRKFQCFKSLLYPAGCSVTRLTKFRGYTTVMRSMVGIIKAWRYVSDGSHTGTTY